MIRTNLHLAFASIRGAKMRTFLTVVAVIIGIGSYTIVTTTVDGLKSAAAGEIEGLGGNLLQIQSGKVLIEDEDGNKEFNFAASFGSSTITEQDLSDVAKIEDVEAIAPLSFVGAQVSREGKVLEEATVIATSPDYPKVFDQKVANGTFFKDEGAEGRFAVVGKRIVDELYGGTVTLGTKITLRGESFTVIGAMEEYVSALDFGGPGDLNNAVFISLDQADKITNKNVSIVEVDMQLSENADPNAVKQAVYDVLLANHGGEEDFTVLTQEEMIELTSELFGIIKQAGQFLSYVMLFVSSIVILLIMLITVRERTREIGIRKSIGATNTNIMTQFLAEAVAISWLGSAIGLAVGFGVGFLVKNATEITPAYSVNTLASLVIISTCVGAIAGVVPAWMASRRDPVESLRHE